MSLSTLKNYKARLLLNSLMERRFLASLPHSATMDRPPPSKIQWKPSSEEVGYFKYERDVSRDSRFSNPVRKGDTPMRFLFRKVGHAFEIYPIFGLLAAWSVLFIYTCYISFDKIEIWLDRSHKDPPWDWERIRDNYWKRHTLCYDPQGVSHRRLEIMEKLQDEMVAAAKARGTR